MGLVHWWWLAYAGNCLRGLCRRLQQLLRAHSKRNSAVISAIFMILPLLGAVEVDVAERAENRAAFAIGQRPRRVWRWRCRGPVS